MHCNKKVLWDTNGGVASTIVYRFSLDCGRKPVFSKIFVYWQLKLLWSSACS